MDLMDEENPGTSHSNRNVKHEKTAEESTKVNGVITLLEENPITDDPCEFTTQALSNFLVLQNIFLNLNGEDLEYCKLVNRRWNYVLGQIYTRHFEVTIKPARRSPTPKCKHNITEQYQLTIQKLGWSSKRSVKKTFSFPDALKLLLEESSKERKFGIDLGIKIPTCPIEPAIEDFLTKIRHLVCEFTSYSKNEFLDPLFRLSKWHFPNLCYLNLTHAIIKLFGGHSWEDYNEFLRDNKLSNLRKICFGQSLEHFKIPDSLKVAELLIEMAPNLKEIHEFPVQLVDALISTGKTDLVKSVCFPNDLLIGENVDDDDIIFKRQGIFEVMAGGPLEAALKKFAQLDPKLISFNFSIFYRRQWDHSEHPYPFDYFYHEYLKSPISQILESSHQSLETLALHLLGSFDFQEISPITSLKKIQFIRYLEFDDAESFTTNVNMERVFPNVTTVEIVMYCDDDDYYEFYAPLRLFSPWGSKIKELILKEWFCLFSRALRPLAASFPSLTSFKFLGDRPISPNTLMKIFPKIADFWPGLEVITITMMDQYRGDGEYSFDSVFTGIPKESLTQLKTPTGRKEIPEEKIEAFYLHSTIRKLSSLKRLELDIDYSSAGERERFLDKLGRITFLSKEFGFDFLPSTFKILIRERGSPSIFKVQRDLIKIQEDLSTVVALEFETMIGEKLERVFY